MTSECKYDTYGNGLAIDALLFFTEKTEDTSGAATPFVKGADSKGRVFSSQHADSLRQTGHEGLFV